MVRTQVTSDSFEAYTYCILVTTNNLANIIIIIIIIITLNSVTPLVVPVKFYLETKSVMESSGGFNVCVVLENTMLGNATAFVGINGSTRDGKL